MTSRNPHRALLVACILLVAGCVSNQSSVDPMAAPDGAPASAAILSDLARNDALIDTLRAGASVVLESPDLEATQSFSTGSVRFQRPGNLYVQGNHRITNTPLFKLRASGREFLIEVPANYTQNYISLEGEWFDGVPFSVSPADIARELFLPEDWGDLSPDDVRIMAYDEETGRTTLAIGPRDAPRRLVEVAHVDPANPAWVVVRNSRLSPEGTILAEATLGEYVVIDGIRIPTALVAEFPTEATRMELNLRNVRLNVEVAPADFDVRNRAVELGLLSPAEARKQ